MLQLLSDPQVWIAFATLTALELVLGIDNIIFISILVDKLPLARREFARRIGLLLVLAWIVGLVKPLFSVFGQEISGRDLILILGGLFLIWKSTSEVHQSLEGEHEHKQSTAKATFASVLLMMLFAGPIGRFVSNHPTIKMLALSFLVVVGVVLVAEGFEHHVPKGYVYFAMAFSLSVEMLNIRMRKKSAKPVVLNPPHIPGD